MGVKIIYYADIIIST